MLRALAAVGAAFNAPMTKCPGLLFRKRDAKPLLAISREIAAYRVAAGVLPPGLIHNLDSAMRSISCGAVKPDSAILPESDDKTLAAASSALRGRFEARSDVACATVPFVAELAADSRSALLARGFFIVACVEGRVATRLWIRALRRERGTGADAVA